VFYKKSPNMTKFNEITDPSERSSKINYINELWSSWSDGRAQTLSRITNYLFVLNTGALLAALTYVASKSANSYIQCSIWFFSAGILLSVVHATLDYYLTETAFSSYQKDVEELYENKMDWEVLVDQNDKRPKLDWLLHILGWLGGLVFFIGLVTGILHIH
jgi:hypothetical protein